MGADEDATRQVDLYGARCHALRAQLRSMRLGFDVFLPSVALTRSLATHQLRVQQ